MIVQVDGPKAIVHARAGAHLAIMRLHGLERGVGDRIAMRLTRSTLFVYGDQRPMRATG